MGIVKSLERGLGALYAFGFVVKPLASQLFRSGLGVLLEHGESLGMKQWSESHSYGLSENHAHGLAPATPQIQKSNLTVVRNSISRFGCLAKLLFLSIRTPGSTPGGGKSGSITYKSSPRPPAHHESHAQGLGSMALGALAPVFVKPMVSQ